MNKITPDIECTCRISSQPVLKLVAGNDFTMRISMTKTQGDSTVPYDLSNAEDLVVNAVALDGTTIELDSFIEDTSHIIASVDAQQFDMYVKYSIEVIWRDEPYDKRACTSDVFMWVATQQEANQAQNEIVSGPYDYELEIINDIAYVMIGTIPSTEGAVTYAQLEQELSYYATISYVQEAISYVEVDMSDYYNKTEIDTTLASYATQTYVTEAISNIPDTDLSDYYTKSEIDTTLSSYVTSSDLDTTLGSYVTYTDWDTNNQSVSYDLGYLDDRVTYIEQNGGGGSTSGVSEEDWDNSNEAVAQELVDNRLEHLSINNNFNNYYTKTEADSRYATASWANDKFVTKADDVNRQQAIAAAFGTSVQSTTVHNIWTGSQNDYDAITTKDTNTLYIIL